MGPGMGGQQSFWGLCLCHIQVVKDATLCPLHDGSCGSPHMLQVVLLKRSVTAKAYLCHLLPSLVSQELNKYLPEGGTAEAMAAAVESQFTVDTNCGGV
jgi:hypothetical protein